MTRILESLVDVHTSSLLVNNSIKKYKKIVIKPKK